MAAGLGMSTYILNLYLQASEDPIENTNVYDGDYMTFEYPKSWKIVNKSKDYKELFGAIESVKFEVDNESEEDPADVIVTSYRGCPPNFLEDRFIQWFEYNDWPYEREVFSLYDEDDVEINCVMYCVGDGAYYVCLFDKYSITPVTTFTLEWFGDTYYFNQTTNEDFETIIKTMMSD
ncbi:hypothetical protein FVF72_00125 [Methanothermobacter sp. KEPCO-1]|uniref:hypothetical protein n=1 Tax=Methanothermobacter sp. KEPCO-1 TaxID=2603820 RepID=UPI0011CC2BD9|nr:hypothetical protein [Methanothermobacter sp. KEPCO-1]QEF93681.1 hypothetical protein FVF72_00030 [Methanothermobacter sp. KEPCO-1]QEF93700.1 hypothetical protein FVF72_00125 [Methanothermobacter sp. KEPCO-1]